MCARHHVQKLKMELATANSTIQELLAISEALQQQLANSEL